MMHEITNILVMQACSKWLKVFNSRCRKSTILVERAILPKLTMPVTFWVMNEHTSFIIAERQYTNLVILCLMNVCTRSAINYYCNSMCNELTNQKHLQVIWFSIHKHLQTSNESIYFL